MLQHVATNVETCLNNIKCWNMFKQYIKINIPRTCLLKSFNLRINVVRLGISFCIVSVSIRVFDTSFTQAIMTSINSSDLKIPPETRCLAMIFKYRISIAFLHSFENSCSFEEVWLSRWALLEKCFWIFWIFNIDTSDEQALMICNKPLSAHSSHL